MGERRLSVYNGRSEVRSMPSLSRKSAQGVVYRRTPDGVLLALVERQGPAGGPVWILPHADLTEGEGGEEAVCRAASQETGVSVRVRERLGDLRTWIADDSNGHRSMVEMDIHQFLLEAEDHAAGAPEDSLRSAGRPIRWLTLDEALRCASFENDRAVVRKAAERLGRLG